MMSSEAVRRTINVSGIANGELCISVPKADRRTTVNLDGSHNYGGRVAGTECGARALRMNVAYNCTTDMALCMDVPGEFYEAK